MWRSLLLLKKKGIVCNVLWMSCCILLLYLIYCSCLAVVLVHMQVFNLHLKSYFSFFVCIKASVHVFFLLYVPKQCDEVTIKGIQIQSSVLASRTCASCFLEAYFFPSGHNASVPMSSIPGVCVLLVPSPGPVAAKVTWQGAAADGSRSAGPDGPLRTCCLCWLLLKVRHHGRRWEAKRSSCQWQIWNTKAAMTRKWKEKMFPLAAENVPQCLIDSRWSERLAVFLELGGAFSPRPGRSLILLWLCAARDLL